jgi:hypothetical protein
MSTHQVQFLSSKEKKHGTLSAKYLEFTFRKTTKNNVFMDYSESGQTIE